VKPGAKQQAGAGKTGVTDEDEDDRPRALEVQLSVRLCLLSCDDETHTQPAAVAAATAADDNN